MDSPCLDYINKEEKAITRQKRHFLGNINKLETYLVTANLLGFVKDFLLTIAEPVIKSFIKSDNDSLMSSWIAWILPETQLHNSHN